MNKNQLIDALSAHYDGNKRAAQKALESVVDTVMREVARGEKVAITGFGHFEKVVRPARTVRNPATGERVRAKKTAVPKFRPGSQLKEVVSGARKLPRLAVSTSSTGGSTTSTAKKAPATKSSTAKKASTAKKSTAKKAPARKSTAKKSTAKKAPAKKSTAKKSTAKKAPAKKSSTAKKAPAKKSSTAKKAPTKKSSTAKKSTAKKS